MCALVQSLIFFRARDSCSRRLFVIRLVSEKGILARGLAHPVVFRSLVAARSRDVEGAVDGADNPSELNGKKTPPTVRESGNGGGGGGEEEGGKGAKGGRGSGEDMLEFFTKVSKQDCGGRS